MYPVDAAIVPAARCEAGDAMEDVDPAHDAAVLQERAERGVEETDARERHRKSWMLRWTTTLVAAAPQPIRLSRTEMAKA